MNLARRIRMREKIMRWVFAISALAAIIAVGLICLFLIIGGIPGMARIGVLEFLFGRDWFPMRDPASFGILPMIVGSLYVTAGAIIIGVPTGIFTAVFMARMCPKTLHRILKPMSNLLAGIPSVVYGFFGMTVIVPFVAAHFGGFGFSILTASVIFGHYDSADCNRCI